MGFNVVRLAKEFALKIGGNVVARCTDFSFSVDRETIDISSFDTDGWRDRVSGLKDWNISFSSLVTREAASGDFGATDGGSGVYDVFFDIMVSDSGDYPVEVVLTAGDGTGSEVMSGEGIIQNLTIDGSVGAAATYSGTIEGAGGFD